MKTCLVTEKSIPAIVGQMNQWMVEGTVGDVIDDRFAGVETA